MIDPNKPAPIFLALRIGTPFFNNQLSRQSSQIFPKSATNKREHGKPSYFGQIPVISIGQISSDPESYKIPHGINEYFDKVRFKTNLFLNSFKGGRSRAFDSFKDCSGV